MTNKILHGDCLELMKDIPNGSIDMILADLPYGTTACKWDTIIPFAPLWEAYDRVIKPNGAIVLFGSEPFSSALRMSNIKNYKYDWIWEKNIASNFMGTKYQPLKYFENISVFNKHHYYPIKELKTSKTSIERFKYKLKGSDKKKDILGGFLDDGKAREFDNKMNFPNSIRKINVVPRYKGTLHPTQKPVELFQYLIKTYTNECETVLDNTAGSGTTAIACLEENRNFIVIEKEFEYYEIIKKRVANFKKVYEQKTLFETTN
jgi:DNA modification methylase